MRLEKNAAGLLALTLLTLGVAATARAGEIPPAAQEMAQTYGLDAFGQIEGIRYTWNAEYPGAVKPFDDGSGTIKVSRTWEWDPKTGTVSFEGKDNNGQPLKVTYQRSQLSSQSDVVKNQVDPNFFNDQYKTASEQSQSASFLIVNWVSPSRSSKKRRTGSW